MGPLANKRYDDPSSKKLDFEDNAKIIVGTSYFNKVKQLYNEIVDFNTNFKESDEYNRKAMNCSTKNGERKSWLKNNTINCERALVL